MREHMASVSVANGVRGPIQALTCRHEPLSYLKTVNKLLVRGRQQHMYHMFELQLPLDHWHCLIRYLKVVFLPPQGSILVCKYDGQKQHSRQYISGMMTQLAIFSSSLCCHMSRIELFY